MLHHDLKTQYSDGISRFERLRTSVLAQISELLETNDLALGVPIESRVKSWESIEEKLERKAIQVTDIRDLQDLVGIRIILLFRNDLDAAIRLISHTFEVLSSEDAGERLGDSQFGYQSRHIIVKIPRGWLEVPIFASLDDLCVELQIRTLAQHIWAAASHKLQYKNEESVPPPIRRAINRASALLETVDLEFDRVLDARRQYVESSPEQAEPSAPLNVDSLALLLSEELPPENKKSEEDYADLLIDLTGLNVSTAVQLRKILRRHMDAVRKADAQQAASHSENATASEVDKRERLDRGVYFAHVGLARTALRKEFGDEKMNRLFEKRLANKSKARPRKKASPAS
ncbi:MAG: hypothetical protein JJU25_19315 [Halomonas sp.]|nr:hypothetical protein [Halomonas sp.]MCC5884774.1 hypothetical protein [Halomonas sp.]